MSNFINNNELSIIDVNYIMSSNKLTLEEKAIYIYLISKPYGWIFSTERITNEFDNSLSTIKRVVSNLEKKGFLKRSKLKDEKGKFIGMEYEILFKNKF